MEVALRRRLAGVAAMSISQSQQTAVVVFLPGTQEFSAAAFRDAVAEADVEVVSMDVEVCGIVDGNDGLRSAPDPEQPLVRLRGRGLAAGSAVCVSGRLDHHLQPYELEVMTVGPRR